MKILPSFCAAALLLAGCASAPIRYHTLVAPLDDGATGATSATSAAAPFLIDVLPVGVPQQLDQPSLAVRQDASVLAMADNERWAAPLPDEIRAALSAQLTRRLGTQDIAGLARPPGRPVLRIKVQVRRLDAWLGRQVQLDADWSLAFADDNAERMLCSSRLREAAAGAYPELVGAEQHVLAMLAERISDSAKKLQISKSQAATQTACP